MAKMSDNQSPKLTFLESAAPSTPASGLYFIYAKTDGKLYGKNDAGTEVEFGAAGAGIAATIFDAKGDLIGASAADTAARLAASATNDLILAAASGETTGLQWQARSKFKMTVINGGGNKTTTSTSKVAIDTTNLAYLTFTLAVGDVVRCSLVGQTFSTATAGYDFEVDQPTSANVFIGAGADAGLVTIGSGSVRTPLHAMGLFTATEAGAHGFRPAWGLVNAGTLTLCNATSADSDTVIQFIVEKLGPVTA